MITHSKVFAPLFRNRQLVSKRDHNTEKLSAKHGCTHLSPSHLAGKPFRINDLEEPQYAGFLHAFRYGEAGRKHRPDREGDQNDRHCNKVSRDPDSN